MSTVGPLLDAPAPLESVAARQPPDAPRADAPHPLTALAPFLLAIFPALFIAGSSPGQFAAGDLLLIVGFLLALTAAAFAVAAAALRLAGRRRALLARATLLAIVFVAWLCYYIPVNDALAEVARPLARRNVYATLCLALSALVAWAAVRRRPPRGGALRVFALMSALLVATSALHMARAVRQSRARVARSAMWPLVRRPVAVDPARARPGPKRDIYLVVLDGYPNAAVLRAKFRFDNTPFLDSLRALGFTIPARARSNYTATVLSMGSLLNFEHDTLLARDLRPTDRDQTLPIALVQHNRTARFLKARGYQYLLLGPELVSNLNSNPLADYAYEGPPRRSLAAELRTTELRRYVTAKTLLSKVPALQRSYGGDYILEAFRQVHDVPSRPEPTFTQAHFMMPHQPTTLDGNCRPINESGSVVGELAGMPGTRPLFLGAVACANRQVLSLVTDVLRRSTVPPIIVLIGDHGTLSHGWPAMTGRPVDEAAAERLAPLAAFYLPDGGDAAVRDSVTHVNIFRHVLRYYFGADLPPLGNDAFFTQAGEHFLFRPVDERIVIGG